MYNAGISVKNTDKPGNFPRVQERLVIYMENKLKKKSINTVIYLLLAAMLAAMIFVSVYTVASKRRGADDVKTPAVSGESQAPSDEPSDKVIDPAKDRGKLHESQESKETAVTTAAESASATPTDTKASTEVGALPATEDDEKPASVDDHYFVMPVNGFITKAFEIDIPVWSATMCDYRAHPGTDIASAVGSEVISASSGTVCKIWSDPMMGRSLTIDHGDDIYTTYMNLADEVLVSVGEKVGMGQVIGSVGATSLTELAEEPHIHLEMKIGGKYADPLEYIAAGEYLTAEE